MSVFSNLRMLQALSERMKSDARRYIDVQRERDILPAPGCDGC